MLNSLYKFYSGILANRIKKFLPKLIGESQKGFVQNRFIGENTVLTLDILNETKLIGEDGLMILVDFEQAFDSISWEYISKILKIFNFSKKIIIAIIKSLQQNSKSKIVQNGHLSETINLGRGCRQGDPISPYLFVLAVELLGETFRENTEIVGITIHGQEQKISQFADDTTLFMKYNERNLRSCMYILNDFYLISGLKINVEKTKAIKFGMTGGSRMTLCDDLELIWTHEFISLGITYNINSLSTITELNLDNKILEMEKLLTIWRGRDLTLIGKITIIKTLMISKIIHILLSLPRPCEESFERIEIFFHNFLWQDKPPKFRSTLENLTANGCLQFPDIRKIDTIMKSSWIKRLYRTNVGWAATPIYYGSNLIYEYGDVYLTEKQVIPNKFWEDVFQATLEVYKNSNIRGLEHLMSMPIWYNSKIMVEKRQSWVDKGLLTIGDIFDSEGQIFTLEHIHNNLGLRCDFLFYNRLKIRIKNLVGNNQISPQDNIRPRLPFIMHIIESNSKGNKNTYFNSQNTGNNVLSELQIKWSTKLNEDTILDTISNSFKNAKTFSPSVYQHFIQYKLLHRRIVHN